MTDAILFDISRATDLGTLNQYREDARTDGTLTLEELMEVEQAINDKIDFLIRGPRS